MRACLTALAGALLLGVCLAPGRGAAAVPQVRIKDMARVQMGNELPLTGLGLVIGLEGTGDGRRAEFTFQMMANMMQPMMEMMEEANVEPPCAQIISERLEARRTSGDVD